MGKHRSQYKIQSLFSSAVTSQTALTVTFQTIPASEDLSSAMPKAPKDGFFGSRAQLGLDQGFTQWYLKLNLGFSFLAPVGQKALRRMDGRVLVYIQNTVSFLLNLHKMNMLRKNMCCRFSCQTVRH